MPLARASLMCQPIPLFLLVDTHGLVCKCAGHGQALARGIWPASLSQMCTETGLDLN